MSSDSIKDQLKQLCSTGKLVVRKRDPKPAPKTKRTAAPAKKENRVQQEVAEQVKKLEPAPEPEAEPKKLHAWTNSAERMISQCSSSVSRIAVLGSVRDPQLLEKLSAVETVNAKIYKKLVTEQAHDRRRELTTARRATETITNYILTVKEAASVNDVTAEHLPEISTKLAKYLKDLTSCMQAIRQQPLEETAKRMALIDEDNVGRYRIFQRQLDVALHDAKKSAVVIIDLPIVPVLGGGVFTQDLVAAQLPAEPMAGYSVLLKQRIIGLNPEVLEQKGYDKDTYLRLVLNQLNQRSNQNYVLVTETPMADRKRKMYFYWVMASKQLTALLSAGDKQVTVTEWGFAF